MKNAIHVIGFGASTIGFIKRILELKLNEKYNIAIYEKGVDVGQASFGGLKYDGKLIASEEIGGELKVDIEQQRKAQQYIISSINSDAVLEKGNSFDAKDKIYQRFYNQNFTLRQGEFIHVGTDLLQEAIYNIFDEFAYADGIEFKFGMNFSNIINISGLKTLYFNKDKVKVETIEGDIVIFAMGRSGAQSIMNNRHLRKYIIDSSYVDLGIRYEFPDFITAELDKVMYEIKCCYETSNGMTARLFCQNPNGFVTLETYENNGEMLYSVNGHSEHKNKSENTNLAILVRHEFTQPFNDSVAFGTAIARLANMLGGGDKVLLQTYGDFVNGKRTKKIGRVKPTLDDDSFVLGDLNYALTAKTRESIIEFIEQFAKVVPGFNLSDNLCYGVEVKFYSTKMQDKENVYFIGDCSGYTGSIIKAFCHGEILAEQLAK